MKNCLFCKIINREIAAEIIYENQMVIVILDAFPISKGHSLVISKYCSPNIINLPKDYLIATAIVQKKIAKLIFNKLKPKGFNYVNNHNELAGQKIFHYHLHIIPKYEKEYGFYPSKNIKNEKINLTLLSHKLKIINDEN